MRWPLRPRPVPSPTRCRATSAATRHLRGDARRHAVDRHAERGRRPPHPLARQRVPARRRTRSWPERAATTSTSSSPSRAPTCGWRGTSGTAPDDATDYGWHMAQVDPATGTIGPDIHMPVPPGIGPAAVRRPRPAGRDGGAARQPGRLARLHAARAARPTGAAACRTRSCGLGDQRGHRPRRDPRRRRDPAARGHAVGRAVGRLVRRDPRGNRQLLRFRRIAPGTTSFEPGRTPSPGRRAAATPRSAASRGRDARRAARRRGLRPRRGAGAASSGTRASGSGRPRRRAVGPLVGGVTASRIGVVRHLARVYHRAGSGSNLPRRYQGVYRWEARERFALRWARSRACSFCRRRRPRRA